MKIKKLGSILTSVVLCCSLVGMSVSATKSSSELKEERSSVQSDVNSLEAQLTEIIEKITQLKSDIQSKNDEIVKAGEEYDAAKLQEDEQYEAMKLRIQYMYEENSSSLIMERIVESTSITDMLNQVEYVNSVHTYDRQMLEKFIEIKEQVVEKQEKLELEMEELQTMQDECDAQEASLKTLIEEKKDEIATLNSAIQEAIEAEQRAAEEAARREAEARAAAQQAAQQQQQGNSNSGSSNSGSSNSGSSGESNSSGNLPGNHSSVVSAAASYIGVPYLWGGTSYSGIDCSGLTQAAYRAVGISIPRTSTSQRNAGKTVGYSISDAQPGDILCYSGHVAIYAGGGEMIHAPSTGKLVCRTTARTSGLLKVVRF